MILQFLSAMFDVLSAILALLSAIFDAFSAILTLLSAIFEALSAILILLTKTQLLFKRTTALFAINYKMLSYFL
ncbi:MULTISPECIES: hypothetical protein [unclassified Lysinibacillus]|uniref:hypothetical protein n=1 Tax=unclassified Lysinibacillus TaxID=2636778 RepID=UPI0037F3FD8D